MTIKYDVGYNVLVNAKIVKIEKSRNGLFYQVCLKDADNKPVTLWLKEEKIAQKVEEESE